MNRLKKVRMSVVVSIPSGLKYEDPERYEVALLPPLPFSHRKLCFTFTPFVTDSEDDLQWASGTLARLCSQRPSGNCASIFFKNTSLTRRWSLIHIF